MNNNPSLTAILLSINKISVIIFNFANKNKVAVIYLPNITNSSKVTIIIQFVEGGII